MATKGIYEERNPPYKKTNQTFNCKFNPFVLLQRIPALDNGAVNSSLKFSNFQSTTKVREETSLSSGQDFDFEETHFVVKQEIPDFVEEYGNTFNYLDNFEVLVKSEPKQVDNDPSPSSEDAGKSKKRRRKIAKVSCPHCTKEYSGRQCLASHIRLVHLDQRLHTGAHFSKHMKWSHNLEIYSCSLCFKKLATKKSWALHEALVCKVPGKDWGPERLKNEFRITLLTCPVDECGKQFGRSREFVRHMSTDSDGRSNPNLPKTTQDNSHLPCPHCGKFYLGRANVLKHIRLVHDSHQHKCAHCDKTYATKTRLSVHVKWVHTRETFSCSLCSKELATKRRWAIHESTVCKVPDKNWSAERLKKEFNVTLVICPVEGCGRQFPSTPQKLLNVHISTHSRPKADQFSNSILPGQLPCPQCGKGYWGQLNLRKHICLVHLGERPHKCAHCDKAYSTKYALTQHISWVHKKERFPCSKCCKGLATRKRWAIHEATVCNVSGWGAERLKTEFHVTLFPCSVEGCGKQFTSHKDWKKHSSLNGQQTNESPNKMHPETRKLLNKCEHCDRKYSTVQSLLKHIRMAHPKQTFSCSVCAKGFPTRKTCAIHETTICQGGNWSKEKLKREFDVTLVPCPIAGCGKQFQSTRPGQIKNHAAAHSVERPKPKKMNDWPCPRCETSLSTKRILRSHIRVVHGSQRPFKCVQCDKTFSKPYYLDKHVKWVHKRQTFSCSVCAKEMASRRSCAIHEVSVCKVKTWSGEKLKKEFNLELVPCPVERCGKLFEPSRLRTHLSTSSHGKEISQMGVI